jgi:hypothetical protein
MYMYPQLTEGTPSPPPHQTQMTIRALVAHAITRSLYFSIHLCHYYLDTSTDSNAIQVSMDKWTELLHALELFRLDMFLDVLEYPDTRNYVRPSRSIPHHREPCTLLLGYCLDPRRHDTYVRYIYL